MSSWASAAAGAPTSGRTRRPGSRRSRRSWRSPPASALADRPCTRRPRRSCERECSSSCCSAGRSIVPPNRAYHRRNVRRGCDPASCFWLTTGLARFSLGVERVELLFEPLFRRLARVDRAAQLRARWRTALSGVNHAILRLESPGYPRFCPDAVRVRFRRRCFSAARGAPRPLRQAEEPRPGPFGLVISNAIWSATDMSCPGTRNLRR